MFSLSTFVIAPQAMQFCVLPVTVDESNDCFEPKPYWLGTQVPQFVQQTSARPDGVFMALGAPVGGHELVAQQVSSNAGCPPSLAEAQHG